MSTRTVDRDRIYEPEQFNQLAKDLVAARGSPLRPYEHDSLRRWRLQGLTARIRRLHDGTLTCWPTDLATTPAPSRIGKRRTTPQEAFSYLSGQSDYGVSVTITFDKTDADLLRAAALTDPEPKLFTEAVASIERNSKLVVRVMNKDEWAEIQARLLKAGLVHITVEALRMGNTKPVRV